MACFFKCCWLPLGLAFHGRTTPSSKPPAEAACSDVKNIPEVKWGLVVVRSIIHPVYATQSLLWFEWKELRAYSVV